MGKNSQTNTKFNPKLKVAIIVDFLMYLGGAEQVLKNICNLFPNASIYTLFYNKKFVKKYFPKVKIKASWLQKIKLPRRLLIFFYPSTIENFNLDQYDIVISTGTWSKGIITKPTTLHINYCHSPNRFLWEDQQKYIKKNVFLGFYSIVKILFHFLRIWDYEAAKRPDIILANSKYTQKRIKKYYRRNSELIYPSTYTTAKSPVISLKEQDNKAIPNLNKIQNYFLIVSRLQYYKNIDLAIKTFNELSLPLIIVGKGREEKKLKKMAKKNVKLLGFVSDSKLQELYKNARAVILPCVEDFGLIPIEAMNCSTPVLCFKKGGALEYIKPGINGEFFDKNTIKSLKCGINKILNTQYNKTEIINSVTQFTENNFKQKLLKVIKCNYYKA